MSDDQQRHRREHEIFQEAVARQGTARDGFVDAACGHDHALRDGVRALLALDAAGDSSPVLRVAVHDPDSLAASELPHGTTVGPFRVVGVLGRGGMGTVYDAEQDRPRRRVALKVMHVGVGNAAALRRFEFEAEVLGRLHHPCIAQVHQAGTALLDGVTKPWFAMERVDGVPITDHARQQRLDVAAKLTLLLDVCDAVDHAHHGGVIHRDLKPANILVGADGRPKVLDFGIARAIDAGETAFVTRVGQMVGTLAYMSPEQATGESARLGPQSDVHALAVVGYELLTGELPYPIAGESVTRALHLLVDGEPIPLARRGRAFHGDLDTIFGKALEKDPTRRYATAAALRDDLRRFLQHETISARPPSALYHARKFARRHRGLVAGVAFAALALVVGSVVSVSWAVRAQAAEGDATQQARLATRVTEFVLELFRSAAPEVAYGKVITAKDLVEQGRRRLEAELADEPLLRAEVGRFLGGIFVEMGEFAAATPLITQALADLRATVDPNDPRLVDALYTMGLLATNRGQLDEGRRQVTESLALHERIGGARDERVARCLQALGSIEQRSGNLEAASRHFAAGLAIREATGKPRDVARSLIGIAGAQQLRGDLDGAAATFQRIEALVTDAEDPAMKGSIAANLGNLRIAQGRLDEAEVLFRRALALGEALLGKEHPLLVRRLNNVAGVLGQAGRFDDAIPFLDRAIALAGRLDAGQDDGLATALLTLGNVRAAKDDLAGAVLAWGRAAAIFERIGPQSAALADVLENLAFGHTQLGHTDEAAALRARVEAIRAARGR